MKINKRRFKAETAGSIMKKEFLAVSETDTIEDAIKHFRSAALEKVLKPSYVYAVDSDNRLVGVVQIRDLLSRSSETRVKDIMIRDVVKVSADLDREEAVRYFIKHRFLALPIVDKTEQLLGVITADDMVDVAESEAEEDIAGIIGTGVGEITTRSIRRVVKLRLPWLAVSVLSGLGCAFILGIFKEALKDVIALALFIPIVLGLSESVGTQSSTIVVRNMALGRSAIKDIKWLLRKEILVGVIIGLVCGLIVGFAALIWQGSANLGLALAFSMILSIISSGVIGSFLPFFFRYIKIDPALASGPIVLAVCDIVTLLIYFRLSSFLLMGK